VLPEAATKATPAGAKAFIEYYWQLIHYAEVTGDVRPLKKVSGPHCDGCNDGINAIRSHYKSGGRVIGGGYRLTFQSVEELDIEAEAAYGIGARLTTFTARQKIIDGDGSSEEMKPGRRDWSVALLWVADHWRVDVMELT
jgi:hypothetical protein